MPYVDLNPDGIDDGLFLIVEAKTGVFYNHQCCGHACMQNKIEGFIVPLTNPKYEPAAKALIKYFDPYPIELMPPDPDYQELRKVIQQIKVEFTLPPVDKDVVHWGSEWLPLDLDDEKLADLVEAWIPVKSPYGRGVIIFANSD